MQFNLSYLSIIFIYILQAVSSGADSLYGADPLLKTDTKTTIGDLTLLIEENYKFLIKSTPFWIFLWGLYQLHSMRELFDTSSLRPFKLCISFLISLLPVMLCLYWPDLGSPIMQITATWLFCLMIPFIYSRFFKKDDYQSSLSHIEVKILNYLRLIRKEESKRLLSNLLTFEQAASLLVFHEIDKDTKRYYVKNVLELPDSCYEKDQRDDETEEEEKLSEKLSDKNKKEIAELIQKNRLPKLLRALYKLGKLNALIEIFSKNDSIFNKDDKNEKIKKLFNELKKSNQQVLRQIYENPSAATNTHLLKEDIKDIKEYISKMYEFRKKILEDLVKEKTLKKEFEPLFHKEELDKAFIGKKNNLRDLSCYFFKICRMSKDFKPDIKVIQTIEKTNS